MSLHPWSSIHDPVDLSIVDSSTAQNILCHVDSNSIGVQKSLGRTVDKIQPKEFSSVSVSRGRGSQILCGMVLEWTSRQTLQPRWILFSWIDNLEKRADVVYSWPQNRAHKVGMVVIYFHGAAGNTTTKVKHRTNSVAPYSFTYALKRWKLTIQ